MKKTIFIIAIIVIGLIVGIIYLEQEEKKLEKVFNECIKECKVVLSSCLTNPKEDIIAFEDVPCWITEMQCKSECEEEYGYEKE